MAQGQSVSADVAEMSGVEITTGEENGLRATRAKAALGFHRAASGVWLVSRKHLHPSGFLT